VWPWIALLRSARNDDVLPPRRPCRVAARDAAEGGARHEADARRIIVVEQAAHHLAAGVEAGAHTPVSANHFGCSIRPELDDVAAC
jgi:hypothetical protein